MAANGDVIVTGGPPASFRRYGSDGILKGSVPMDKSVFDFGGWINAAVDPTDDSILLFRPNPGRAVRVSAATGKVIASYKFPSGLYDFALDGAGRMYLVCGSQSTACDMETDVGDVLQYGRSGKALLRRHMLERAGKCWTGEIAAMARATDGLVRTLERGTAGSNCSAPGPVRAAKLTADLRQRELVEVPYESDYNGSLGPDVSSIAGDATGLTLIAEEPWRSKGMDEFRLRLIAPDGHVKAWWGHGGDQTGPRNPSAVALTPDGTIWALDADPLTNIGRVMYLPPGP